MRAVHMDHRLWHDQLDALVRGRKFAYLIAWCVLETSFMMPLGSWLSPSSCF
jgi:hypothetical protein